MRFTLLFVMIVNINALAQEGGTKFKKDWFLDVSIGVNQSKLSGSAVKVMDDLSKQRSLGGVQATTRTGIEVTCMARKVLAENFHARVGFNYLQRGGALKKSGYVEEPAVSTDYIGLPVLLGMSSSGYNQSLPASFILEGGVAYLLQANDKSSTWAEYKHTPIDLMLEAGIEFRLKENIALSVRYKFMKNLTRSYSFDWVPEKDYDWFYQTNTALINLSYKLNN